MTIRGSGFSPDAYTHANLVFFGTVQCDVDWYALVYAIKPVEWPISYCTMYIGACIHVLRACQVS